MAWARNKFALAVGCNTAAVDNWLTSRLMSIPSWRALFSGWVAKEMISWDFASCRLSFHHDLQQIPLHRTVGLVKALMLHDHVVHRLTLFHSNQVPSRGCQPVDSSRQGILSACWLSAATGAFSMLQRTTALVTAAADWGFRASLSS